jgi:hypothetical protein
MNAFVERLIREPKKVLFIDGAAAFLSGLLLITVVKPFEDSFGMPGNIVLVLGIVAFGLSIYSFSTALLLKDHWRFLEPLIIANLLYCLSTLGLLVYYYERLTVYGKGYFFIEIIIISFLVYLESKARISSSKVREQK